MLPDSKINISLPKVTQRPHPLLHPEEFVPVIRVRRYNLIKIKELCELKERDIRLGRVKTESSNLERVMKAEQAQRRSYEAYRASREDRCRMRNQSYLGLMQKMRSDLRTWSIER